MICPRCNESVTPGRMAHHSTKHRPVSALQDIYCQCGRPKKKGEAFCNHCYFALPLDLRRFLYRRIGDGFEGAFAAAFEWLENKYGEKINVNSGQ